MTSSLQPDATGTPTVQQLLHQLQHAERDATRLQLLLQLCERYLYTDLERAETYLYRAEGLLQRIADDDISAGIYSAHRGLLENQRYDFQAALHYHTAAVEAFRMHDDVHLLADAYIDLATSCINVGHINESVQYLDAATELLKRHPGSLLRARIACRWGSLYNHLNIYDDAVKAFEEALQWVERLSPEAFGTKDYNYQAAIHYGLAYAYTRQGRPEESAPHYRRAIALCEAHSLIGRLSWYYLSMGRCYLQLGRRGDSVEYFNRIITGKLKDTNSVTLGLALANMAELYSEVGNYGLALDMYERARLEYLKSDDTTDINLSLMEMGRAKVYHAQRKSSKAEQHFKAAYDYAKQSDSSAQMAIVCRNMASFYSDTHDYAKAYGYQRTYSEYRDQELQDAREKALHDQQQRYELEQKAQQNELLRLQATELKLKALRAQMSPHFVYNILSSLQHLISSDQRKDAEQFVSRFSVLIRRILENSERETIPLEEEVDFLDTYLGLEQQRFRGEFTYRIVVGDEVEEDIMSLPPMIVQPYVENAIKHGVRLVDNGCIEVHFQMADDDTLLCVVQDNGRGRAAVAELQATREDGHRSMGTKITQDRLHLLNQSMPDTVAAQIIDLYDAQGRPSGTRVEIRLPVVTG